MAFRLGIVGSESAKFTEVSEGLARASIIRAIGESGATHVVSGGCHLGGIDIWAVEEARKLGLEVTEHLPRTRQWSGGYKDRNVRIAEDSDKVICITVRKLPKHYKGMRFDYCYHCGTNEHIKSGGCWTTKYARSLGKPTETVVIDG